MTSEQEQSATRRFDRESYPDVFMHDEPCEVCGVNAQRQDRLTRTIDVTYGHFHVCWLCDHKLPEEWQYEP